MRDFQLAIALITQPRKAFAELDERPRFWFPLLLSVGCTLALLLWYYAVVDVDWLIDKSLSANARAAQMTEEQRAMVASRMSRNVLMWSSVGVGVLAVLGLRLVEATYLLLAGKIVNLQRSFKHWFSLGLWTSLPPLLTVIPSVLLLSLSDTRQMDASVMQPLSLNEIFFHKAMGAPGYTLLTSLSVLQPVAWLLAVIAVQTWSRRSWLFSSSFVLLPVIVCYGAWAAFTLT